jgi:hypothetical protein
LKIIHPDVFRELLALNHLEADYVQTLRTFVVSGFDPDPAVVKRRSFAAPMYTQPLPFVPHREQQELLVAFGAFNGQQNLYSPLMTLLVFTHHP